MLSTAEKDIRAGCSPLPPVNRHHPGTYTVGLVIDGMVVSPKFIY